MADVYLAHQPGPFSAGKLVVIKQLRPGVAEDEQFVHMFADESRIAVRLSHPNVVHTYEVVAEHDEYYLALEFLDGKSLHQILHRVTRNRMPLELHIWMLTQVLTGLHYAHDLTDFDGTPLGIVHRDVSPSNVFVTYDGGVKLLDFGIAKCLGAISATRAGLIKGKLGYAAPEQCLCKVTDRRTDVFSVGIMLWEAIAWRKRAIGETEAGVYHARIAGLEPKLELVCPTAPAELVSICNKAVALEPEQRYQTALEFRQALEGYLRGVGWEGGTDQVRTFMREHFGRDIEEMRLRIDGHIGNSRAPVSGRVPLGMGSTSIRERSPESLPPSADTRRVAMPGARSASDSTWSFRPWYKRPLVWGLGGVVGVGAATLIGAIALFSESSDPPPVARLPQVALPVAPKTSASVAPAQVDKPSAQPAGRVTVSIATKPARAVLRLDGQRISNPYLAVHGRDMASHHLTVELVGFQTVEQELRFDRDVDVVLTLASQVSQRRAKAAPGEGSAPESSTGSPRDEASSRDTEAAQVAEAQKPSDEVQPGEDLGRNTPRIKSRRIDEVDPYTL